MARAANSAAMNIASSPPSGSDRTHYNTPSTNITAVSPVGQGNAPAPKLDLGDVELNGQSTGFAGRLANRRLAHPSTSVTLSPTAAEFTPGARTVVATVPQGIVAPYGFDYSRALANNTPFGAIGQAIPQRAVVMDAFKDRFTALGPNVVVSIGQFSSEDNTSRVFEITNVTNPDALEVAASFPVGDFKSLVQIDSSAMHQGTFRIVFSGIRDARQAFIRAAYTAYPRCKLSFMSPKNFAASRGQNPALVSEYAAQLLLTVVPNQHANEAITIAELYHVLSQAGEVYAVHSVEANGDGPLTLRVEYCDTRDAASALGFLNARDFAGLRLRAAVYQPDMVFNAAVVPYGHAQARLSLTGRSTMSSVNLHEAEALMARVMITDAPSTRGFGRTGHNQVDVMRIQEGVDVRTTIMLRNIPNKVTQADLKEFLDETSYGTYDFTYLRIDFANNCNVGYAFINFTDPLAIIPFAQARAGAKWNIHDSNKVAEISYATIQGRDCLVQKFRNSSVMLEHPSFRPKLYYAGAHHMAGEEEPFPDPDNFSKMRRSIENAEHIGLFRPSFGGHKLALAPARLRPGAAEPQEQTPVSSARAASSPVVDIDHPNDPFAAWPGRQALPITRPIPASTSRSTGLFAPREGQQHREEQRRRRSQFDRGNPGAEYEAGAHRMLDPALDRAGHAFTYQPRVAQAFRGRY